jgi:hypothetical protein
LYTQATSYDTGFDFITVKRFPLLSKHPRQNLGHAQPPIQGVLGDLSPGIKRARREAGHSPKSNAEVKIRWSYTSTPRIHLHGVFTSNSTFTDKQ